MTTQRRSRPRFVQTLKPRLTWRTFQKDAITLLPGALGVFNLGSEGSGPSLAALGILGDFTVRRIRGRISMFTREAADTIGYDVMYYGVMIVSTDAALTAGAVPDPETDSSSWMLWDTVLIPRLVVNSPLVNVEQLLETKAMRKVNENNSTVILAIKADLGNDSLGVGFTFAGRLLVSHGRQ